MWPFGSNDTEPMTDVSGPEVLIAGGGDMYQFEPEQAMSKHEAVKISGNRSVAPCNDMDEFYGIVPYDTAKGEPVPIIQAPALVRVRATGPVEPNSGVGLVDSLTWEKDDAHRNTAIVHAYNKQNCMIELELRPAGRILRV